MWQVAFQFGARAKYGPNHVAQPQPDRFATAKDKSINEGVCALAHRRELLVRRARLAGLRTVELGWNYWWALGSLCLHAK